MIFHLISDVADLFKRVRHVGVALEEVEDRLAEDFEGEAHVAVVVERVKHPDAEVLALRILGV